MHMDIDLIVYAVIAAVFLGRLWVVLGTRNDDEPQRPNPFAPPPPPAQHQDAPLAAPPQDAPRPMHLGPPPNSLAGGLAQIQAVDPTFDEKAFLQERRDVFSTIVSAYAAGNLNSVSEFLSPALLAHFQQAVAARAAAGQSAQTRISRIKEAEVTAARAEGSQAFVTVKFISDQENILRDAGGSVIGGEEGKYEEVVDIWTFARDTQAPGARWVVVETGG
ncbi:MAG: Tim44/TimA family putative adaptor protein [Alphaproteobacteria bacterium]|nr:Tim44/TimA family putative adaptor protein [Alphaproteobacteria bacterium]